MDSPPRLLPLDQQKTSPLGLSGVLSLDMSRSPVLSLTNKKQPNLVQLHHLIIEAIQH